MNRTPLIQFELLRGRNAREVSRICKAQPARVYKIRDGLIEEGRLEPEEPAKARNPLPRPVERATAALRHDADRTDTAIAEIADVSPTTVKRARMKLDRGQPALVKTGPKSRRRRRAEPEPKARKKTSPSAARGRLLATLRERGPMTAVELAGVWNVPSTTTRKRLAHLRKDGLAVAEQEQGKPGRHHVWKAVTDGVPTDADAS